MYGLVNRGLRDLVLMHRGPEAWAAIEARAALSGDPFVSMTAYPDETTLALLQATAETLALDAEEVLERLGAHWVRYSGREGYGELMALSGDDLVEFLSNLDQLHARVGLSFPELRPPGFRLTEVTATRLTLEYSSTRAGLERFVVGLLRGLGAHFGVPLSVQIEARRGADGSPVRFAILLDEPLR